MNYWIPISAYLKFDAELESFNFKSFNIFQKFSLFDKKKVLDF